jgi:molybdopterin-containing oxidoreductase family membrane subunit
MRFWDASAGNYGYVPGRTESQNVLTGGVFAVSFWTWEMILGGLVAAFLLIRARARQSVMALMIGCGLAMAGLVANRWHTTFLAFTQPLSTSPAVTDPLVTPYTPAWTEWATAFAVVSILALGFSLGMRYLPTFQGSEDEA